MDLTVVLTTFLLIFPAELPDKTFVASLVLSTRFRPRWVWVGVVAAFAVQCAIAVAAGGLLSLLPRRPVLAVTAVLFAVGSVLLLRGAAEEDAGEASTVTTDAHSPLRIAATSFGVLFAAEWGDLSQLLTAGLAARHDPVSVFAGSWLALATVAGLAVVAGRSLLRVVPLTIVRRVAGTLFGVLAVVTALEALGVDVPLR